MKPRQRLARLSIRFALLALLALALAAFALVVGVRQVEHRLREQGIEIRHWQGLGWHEGQWRLSTLRLELLIDSGRLEVDLRGLALRVGRWPPALETLTLEQAVLSWRPGATRPAPGAVPLPPPARLHALLAHLPRQLTVDHLTLVTPCAREACVVDGALQLRRPQAATLPVALVATALRPPHRVTLTARLDAAGPPALAPPGKAAPDATASDATAPDAAAPDALDLRLSLALDGQTRLDSSQQLRPGERHYGWQGALAVGSLPEAAWLGDWLAEWLSLPLPASLRYPDDLNLGASWALDLPREDARAAHGDARAWLHLPAPWPVPSLGLLEGDLLVGLQRDDRGVRAETLSARLALRPEPERLLALPAALRPDRLELDARLLEAATAGPSRLALVLRAKGPLDATWQAPDARLDPQARTLDFDESRLTLAAPRLALDDQRLDGVRLTAPLAGRIGPDGGTLQARQPVTLAIRRMESGPRGLVAHDLDARLERLVLAFGDDRPLHLEGAGQLRSARLDHAALRPQAWTWQGRFAGDLPVLEVRGTLGNPAGLQLTHLLDSRPGTLRLDLGQAALRMGPGNPLAETLAAWPASLSLTRGTLALSSRTWLRTGQPVSSEVKVRAEALGGLADRIEFEGLDAGLDLRLDGDRLVAELPDLQVARLDPGLPLGPLRLKGGYRASLANPGDGQLHWQEARLAGLGGELSLAPGQWSAATPSPPLAARLRGLDLRALLAAYPAEGLEGDGLLDGDFQILASPQGLEIDDGRLAARAPGMLRFRSPKLAALGRANPAMRLVAEALEDFRYDRLESDIRYASDGRLTLGLRLEGRNPTLERGRPVHLNVNLEEDIPALLTSLQLSDRVSERLRERVRQRLQTEPSP